MINSGSNRRWKLKDRNRRAWLSKPPTSLSTSWICSNDETSYV